MNVGVEIMRRSKAISCWWIVAILCAMTIMNSRDVLAAIPDVINYQGRITETSGEPLNTTVTMTFAVYSDSIGGAALWTETQPSVTVQSGLFNVLLGTVNPIQGVFNTGDRYLGIQVGLDSEIVPRTRITAVAFAHTAQSSETSAHSASSSYADDADKVDGVDASELEESAEILDAVAQLVDSLVHAPFENLFRCYFTSLSAGEYTVFTAPPDKAVYITGIHCYSFWTDPDTEVKIDGATVLRVGYPGSGVWSSGGGAPIKVLPGQTVAISGDPVAITITGYEF